MAATGQILQWVLPKKIDIPFGKGQFWTTLSVPLSVPEGSCMDNVYSLNEIVQGRSREGNRTYAFFLDVRKAYDTVWRYGLWAKLWDMGVKGRMWRVIKNMYEASRSAILLEGEKSAAFRVEQGVAQAVTYPQFYFQYL